MLSAWQTVSLNMPVKKEQIPAGLRFKCTGCGACCTGASGHYVELGPEEQERIRARLNVSRRWFRHRYITRVDGKTEGLRLEKDGRCPFLHASGRCRIYAVRPAQCRTYPWWPELLQRRAAWNAEARRCEGMNRGPVVTAAAIERALRLQTRGATQQKNVELAGKDRKK